MPRPFNPPTVARPASSYAQGVVHGPGQRLVIAGQVGVRPDGSVVPGLEGQMRQAWANLFAVMADAGFERRHLVKVTVFVTEAGKVAAYRKVRDEVMEGHLAANTYLQVAGLATPDFLVEIEGEAVKD